MQKRKESGNNSKKTTNCFRPLDDRKITAFLVEQGKQLPYVRPRVLEFLLDLDGALTALHSIPKVPERELVSAWRVARLQLLTCKDEAIRQTWEHIARLLLGQLEGFAHPRRSVQSRDVERAKKILP